MILTCPECATSYFVDDARVPAAGRLVKCTSCGARWTAAKPAEPEPDPVASAALKDSQPFVATTADDLEVTPVKPGAARKAARVAPRREAIGKVVTWAVAAVIIAGLVAAAIVFRGQVVRLWPVSQAAYAGLGLPVNAMGLVIEHVVAKPVFQAGRPVLTVTGAIRSLRDGPASAPPLRISLLDRAGKPVAAKVVAPVDAEVPGHATRYFALTIVDPPASVHDLEVTFDVDASSEATGHGAPAAHASVPPAHGAAPQPVEAQPLPPGSQDALPHHE